MLEVILKGHDKFYLVSDVVRMFCGVPEELKEESKVVAHNGTVEQALRRTVGADGTGFFVGNGSGVFLEVSAVDAIVDGSALRGCRHLDASVAHAFAADGLADRHIDAGKRRERLGGGKGHDDETESRVLSM